MKIAHKLPTTSESNLFFACHFAVGLSEPMCRVRINLFPHSFLVPLNLTGHNWGGVGGRNYEEVCL